MKTTPRFDRASTRLYNAFHNGELNAYKCEACAVGNMCNGYSAWACYREGVFGDPINDYHAEKLTGYSAKQLGLIEGEFMSHFQPRYVIHRRGIQNKTNGRDKNTQFKALCGVIKLLCKFDNIPNPMDYTAMFERTESGAAKYQLSEIL